MPDYGSPANLLVGTLEGYMSARDHFLEQVILEQVMAARWTDAERRRHAIERREAYNDVEEWRERLRRMFAERVPLLATDR